MCAYRRSGRAAILCRRDRRHRSSRGRRNRRDHRERGRAAGGRGVPAGSSRCARRRMPQLRCDDDGRVLRDVRSAGAHSPQLRLAGPRHPAQRLPLRYEALAHAAGARAASGPAHAPLHRRRAREVHIADGAVSPERVPDVCRVLVHRAARRRLSIRRTFQGAASFRVGNNAAIEATRQQISELEVQLAAPDLPPERRIELQAQLPGLQASLDVMEAIGPRRLGERRANPRVRRRRDRARAGASS